MFLCFERGVAVDGADNTAHRLVRAVIDSNLDWQDLARTPRQRRDPDDDEYRITLAAATAHRLGVLHSHLLEVLWPVSVEKVNNRDGHVCAVTEVQSGSVDHSGKVIPDVAAPPLEAWGHERIGRDGERKR